MGLLFIFCLIFIDTFVVSVLQYELYGSSVYCSRSNVHISKLEANEAILFYTASWGVEVVKDYTSYTKEKDNIKGQNDILSLKSTRPYQETCF